MYNATDNPYLRECVPDPYDPNQGDDLVLARPKEVCDDGFGSISPLQLAACLKGIVTLLEQDTASSDSVKYFFLPFCF